MNIIYTDLSEGREMKSKVGSKVHKSTAIKPKAGVIDFSGRYIKGRVWSKEGTGPALYSSKTVADRMAFKYGLRAEYAGGYWVLME